MLVLAVGWTITALPTIVIISLLLIPVMIVASLLQFAYMAYYAAYNIYQGVGYRYPLVADLTGESRRV